MIRLTTIALALISLSASIQGQVITIQSGMALSKLDWQVGTFQNRAYDSYRASIPIFMGVEYFNKKYFNLSSNIGYLEKGGKGASAGVSINGNASVPFNNEARLQYVSLNTCGELKYPIDKKLTVYASVGPRMDYLAEFDRKIFGVLDEANELNKIIIGINYGVGVKYTINKTVVGLSSNVYRNFNSIAKWSPSDNNLGGNVNDRTYTLLLSLGYDFN
jgi:hypothetical protein